ncbi:uncharacterized protein LOC117580095 isoform X2 [Drosophila guanche]|uniref:EB domain-containing protein n=1 Tax=Drosophila guanche TaxID=7266 RepID=A0A3B0J973_DROGU|nr:uncharacterized protein LOC117580095 isoform X2 [Drosophila guanche]SPP76472.1 Hypothetical predicted protein [Drosophila guanche]
MEKLTLPRLLQRLQLLALQLATTPSRQPPHQQQQQQHPHPHGCHLMAMQLCQAMLLYGCLLLLHASVSVSASASHTALALNLSSAIDLNQLKHHPEQQQPQPQPQPQPEYPQTAQQPQQPQRAQKRDAANVPDDDYDGSYPDDIDELDALLNNKSAKGKYIGAPCNELKCDVKLLHVACDKETQTCTCERNYPVQLGPIKGCAKPKKLGDQCFYDETCTYNDENSLCVQVRHNAMCQCASGFHSVSYTKPTRRVFCTPDLSELSSDLPTLLGVSTGIAVLAGLICMVLHLFSKTKYPRHRNYGDASIPPPILYSSDTGIPLTVHSARPSSRSSIRSTGSIGSFGQRRASVGGQASGAAGGAGGGGGVGGGVAGGGGGGSGGGGSKGILVSTSRTGSRRPSLASVHSTSSSVRSYSMMRFEKEAQQKEIRQEMKLRLARLQQQQHLTQNKPQIVIGEALLQHGALGRVTIPTPSPLTPNSLDELLPSLDENQEYPPRLEGTYKQLVQPGASACGGGGAGALRAAAAQSSPASANGYHGPCSSSTEAL